MVHWLIEENVFKCGMKLVLELQKKQVPFLTCIYSHKIKKEYISFFDEEACVIFHGSLRLASQINREAPWTPGAYCNLDQFFCTYYYPIFGDKLLNSKYIMMPLGDLVRNKDFLFSSLGSFDNLFVRPNSGNKCFTGKPISYDSWENDIDIFQISAEAQELVIVSRSQAIKKEWRFFVAEKKIITGSEYLPEQQAVVPERVIDFAEQMALYSYEPDPIWVLDICQLNNGELKVLEVNSFSCSGWYNCDVGAIVDKANDLAQAEWNEIYCI